MCVQLLSCGQLFGTPWIVANQAPLSVGFPRQEHWSGLPFPPPGDLPSLGIKPTSLTSLAFAGGFLYYYFFTTEPPGKPLLYIKAIKTKKYQY